MAKEYIEREAAIAEIEEWHDMYPDSDAAREALSLVKRAVQKIPAADVRPVVTCIECKHSCDMPGGLRCCYGTCLDCYVDPEFFCADGEKREES